MGKCPQFTATPPQQMPSSSSGSGHAARYGVTFGTALAISISWSLHKSVFWAIVNGLFSWFYVVYYMITRAAEATT